MNTKPVYQLSARQILLLSLATAIAAVVISALAYQTFQFLSQPSTGVVTLAETSPDGISDPATVTDEQNNIEVYRAISPGVAFINTTSYSQNWWGDVQEGRGNGSGSVIDAQGHILTNYHVIERAQRITVNFGGDKVFPARLIGGDPDTDLAIIKIDAPANSLTVVPLGDSDQLTVGQKVLAIGNPFGLDRTLTTGVISGLQRPIRARNDRPIDAAIQTDASINLGNSGGPLLDKFGRMIGINSQILSPSGGSVGVGFAVPVNTAKRVIPQLIQFGEVRRPKLGASLPSVAELSKRYRLPIDRGLLVYQVLPGGSADRAGIRPVASDGTIGDIILSVNGQPTNEMDELYRILDRSQFGETLQVEVFRQGQTVTVPVRLLPNTAQSNSRRVQ